MTDVQATTDATAAQKADATSAKLQVSYDGETYEIDPPDLWPIDLQEAVEARAPARLIAILLGDEQYRRFKRGGRPMGDLEKLALEIGKVAGTGNL